MAPNFDGVNLVITLESGVTEVDARSDLYGAWKTWQHETDAQGNTNRRFPPAFRTSGGDALTPILDAGGYFFLRNDLGWRIRPPEEDINITVLGNLVGEDTDQDILIPTIGNFTVLINGLQPITQRVEKIGDLVILTSYAGVVHLATDGSGSPGAVVGTNGTPSNPCDNLTDAMVVAAELGLKVLHFKGTIAIGALDLTGWTLHADGAPTDILTFTGTNVNNAVIEQSVVSGSISGILRLVRSTVNSMTDIEGTLIDCSVTGPLVMPSGGSSVLSLISCTSNVIGLGTPVLNVNGGVANTFQLRAYSGGIEVQNCTNANNVGSIDMISGQVIVGPTNSDGSITLRGVGNLTDTSTGIVIEQNAFLNQTFIAFLLHDSAIWIDTGNGTAGTTPGVNGIPSNPVDNLADAVTLASATGLREYRIRKTSAGPLILTSGHDDWHIVGVGGEVTIALNGQDVDGSLFENIELSGTQVGTIRSRNCRLDGIVDIAGTFEGCALLGVNTMPSAGAAEIVFNNCASAVAGAGATPVLDLNGGTGNVYHFRHYAGGIEIRNSNDAGDIGSIDMVAGQVVLGATNTGGALTIRGVGNLTDNSAGLVLEQGAFINRMSVADAVLDEAVDDHVSAGSLGNAMRLIKQMTAGNVRVALDGLSITVYDEDNTTVLATFSVDAAQKIQTRTS